MAWFTDEDLRDMAGERSYQRGFGYVEVVGDLGDLPDGVVATVHGTGRYRARLTGREDGALDGDCSCPYGQDGNFCKHCVAVGLRLLGEADVDRPRHGRGKARSDAKPVDVKQFLTTMDHAELVELVWRHASDDAALFRRLRLLAATAAEGPDLTGLRDEVARLRVEWIEYGDEHTYASRAEDVLHALDRLVPEHAATVQPLLRHAVAYIGAAAGASEDESGTIIDLAAEAWETYLRACEAAPPDPVEFAEWYAKFQLDGPDWPETSLDDVAGLLGDTGLAAYRQCLDEAARTHHGHWRLRSMREELVAATGDTDAMVACLAEDLTNPHQYLRIAELLRSERRVAEAIEWLERGVSATGPQAHNLGPLVDLLAELYTETGRTDDVIPLRERHFTMTATQQDYQALRDVGRETPQWPAIRERALNLLRKQATKQNWYAADTLAAVLLDEGEIDEAWQVTQAHNCGEQIRLAVTARRAETYPADAIAIYRPLAEAAVAQTNNHGYERAAQLLLMMRPLFARTGENFTGYVTALKETNRRKRNFLAELHRNGL
jgi:uncharacterized Zn finger protein